MDYRSQYLKLQNGSDIRGVAVDGVEGEPVNLTPERVFFIGLAFAEYIAKMKGKKPEEVLIAIGHDSRISAEELEDAAICGLDYAGVQVIDCELASTPSMFMSTVLEDFQADGSIMLTASHLPYNRNGLKFFTAEGGFEKAQIKEVLEAAAQLQEDGKEAQLDREYEVMVADLLGAYSNHLASIIKKEVNAADYDQPLKGLHILVDAGNGAGGFFAKRVLKPLGADISGSQFLEPDGMFPNHIPNPEDQTAMAAIQKATVENKADLGLIFDTDVDRAAAVFADGREVNRNAVIALISAIIAQDHPGTTIVTDSVTSDELAAFLEAKGLKHHRFKRGYKNVINESIRLNNEGTDSQLAMETSGHGALKENYFLDDGAYLCVKMVIELARQKAKGGRIEDLIADLEYPAEAAEFRFKIQAEDFAAYGQETLEKFTAFCQGQETFHVVPNNFEGIRVAFDDVEVKGWLLLRMSLHDPIMPMNIESKREGGVEIIKKRILSFFETCDSLDISSLK